MMRVLKSVLNRSVATAAVAAALAAGLASSASAENVTFGTRPRYNGVPNANGNIVIYNLPASGFGSGPVNTSFDLTAVVQTGGGFDGVETAAGFGLIATLGPAAVNPGVPVAGVVFNPPTIVGDANNLGASINSAFPSNSSFDYRFANTGIQGGGNREIDITAFEQVALQNNAVTNGEGIAAVPVQVAGGAVGNYSITFNTSPSFSGFVKTIAVNNTQFLTPANSVPSIGGTIEVRRSRVADMNGDLNVNAADIGGFVLALNNLASFNTQFPWLQTQYIADINQDGNINAADIGGFIAQINNPSPSPTPSAVPEPGTVGLGVGAAIVACLGMLRRRRAAR